MTELLKFHAIYTFSTSPHSSPRNALLKRVLKFTVSQKML